MEIPDAPTDAELAAYLSGHLSAARSADLRSWIANDLANAGRAEAIRHLLAVAPEATWNRDRIWSNVRAAMTREAEQPRSRVAAVGASSPPRVGRRSRILVVGRLAAAVVALVAGGLYLRRVDLVRRAADPVARPAHEYATRRGERTTIQLWDGSRVTLAPESRLRIAAGFGAKERAVQLEGEGEFDVVHDPTRPFSVRAGRALVVDIGTRFDIRAYAEDRSARVAVAEGAVTLGPDDPSGGAATGARHSPEGVLVQHGEVARLDDLGHANTTPIESEASYFGWTEGRLVFEREPLKDVLSGIARWYDVQVTVHDPALANRLVTAEFSTQSGSEMIHALAQAVDATVAGSGRTFTLAPR